MTKLAPKEGPNNTLPVLADPPKQHLTVGEIRRRAKAKEDEMQLRIQSMTASELAPDLDYYLVTVASGDTIKARRLA